MKTLKCPKRVSRKRLTDSNFTTVKGINYGFLEEEYHRIITAAFKLAAEKGWKPSCERIYPTKRVRTGFMTVEHQHGDEYFINISFKKW